MTILQSILPAAEAFSEGSLEMPVSAPVIDASPTLAWSDLTVNSTLVIAAVVLFLLNIKNFLHILPSLLDCLSRWKGCVKIDASIKLSHERDISTLVFLLPFCLVLDRYDIAKPSFIGGWPDVWQAPAMIGFIIAWIIVRGLCYGLCSLRAQRLETFRTARNCAMDFFIPTTILMLICVGICGLIGCNDGTIRHILDYLCAFLYLVMLVRKSQILRSYCNPFKTFLYLCALEFVPTGILISAVVLS